MATICEVIVSPAASTDPSALGHLPCLTIGERQAVSFLEAAPDSAHTRWPIASNKFPVCILHALPFVASLETQLKERLALVERGLALVTSLNLCRLLIIY